MLARRSHMFLQAEQVDRAGLIVGVTLPFPCLPRHTHHGDPAHLSAAVSRTQRGVCARDPPRTSPLIRSPLPTPPRCTMSGREGTSDGLTGAPAPGPWRAAIPALPRALSRRPARVDEEVVSGAVAPELRRAASPRCRGCGHYRSRPAGLLAGLPTPVKLETLARPIRRAASAESPLLARRFPWDRGGPRRPSQ